MHCSIPGCTRLASHKGLALCNMHYQRLRRYGSTDDRPSRRHTCSVEGCANFVHSRGVCNMHLQRVLRHGDPTVTLRQRDSGSAEERWLKKVSVESPGCWVWTAGTTGKTGYGAYEGISAHLWVWRHLVGPVPDGLELDHLCRVRLCVNPDHLEPVTHEENTRRGIVGQTAYRPEEVRARKAAYMREYMARRRAAQRASVTPLE